MIKSLLFLIFLTAMINLAAAQEALIIQKCQVDADLTKTCEQIDIDKNLEEEIKETKDLSKKWSLFISFGPFITYHNTTSMRLINENTDVKIRHIKPKQRTSFGHYEIFNNDKTNFGQFLDEPQNKFTIELSDGNFFIGVEYSHPKILYHNDENEQVVDISGVINGEEIDLQDVPLNDYFTNITSTYGNANIDIFAGKIFHLLNQKSKHKLDLHLGLAAGVSMSSGDIQDNLSETSNNPKIDINGYAFSTRTKLSYHFPGDRITLNVGHDFVFNKVDGQLDNYKSTTDLISHRFSIGLGVKIFGNKKRKKKKLYKE